jgi:hypothetical protein
MDYAFYVVITSIFGVFVVFMLWWIFNRLTTRAILRDMYSNYTEEDKEFLENLCKRNKNRPKPTKRMNKKTPE